MYCDRETTDIGKSQIGFIKNIVFPIFDTLNLCLRSKEIKEGCIDELENNVGMWESSVVRKRGMTVKAEIDKVTVKARNEITLAGRIGRDQLDLQVFSK